MSQAQTPVASPAVPSHPPFAPLRPASRWSWRRRPGVAQTVQGTPGGASALQEGPPLDTRTLSCEALKDRLQRTGAPSTSLGGKDGPKRSRARPECEFWAKPSFEYVNASAGACGLGYLCQWKPGAGSGR